LDDLSHAIERVKRSALSWISEGRRNIIIFHGPPVTEAGYCVAIIGYDNLDFDFGRLACKVALSA
jgi:hypothetical protein